MSFFSGDVKFASVNQMLMRTSSRKDDLINLITVLMYFKNMDLPWCDFLFCMPCSSQEKTYNLILQKKKELKLHELALINNFSSEFVQIVEDIEGLEFEEKPKYGLYRSLFKQIIDKAPPSGRKVQWKR